MLQLLVGDAVSGTVSLPSRGAFHLSLTVLFRYRSLLVPSLGWWSTRLQTAFPVRRPTLVLPHSRCRRFAYRALTVSGAAFQRPSASSVRRAWRVVPPPGSPQPPHCNATTLTQHRFGLIPVRSPLLGGRFPFLAVLRCFSSRGALSPTGRSGVIRYHADRVAPFGYPRLNAPTAAPRGFSQP